MQLKLVTTTLLGDLSRRAATSQRRRCNHNLHPQLGDPIQRFLTAVEPGTYVRPHRHVIPVRKWELFVILSGAITILLFDGTGIVLDRVEIDSAGANRGIEIPPGAWHTLIALKPGTVLFELKQGPYAPMSDKDFAPWAPLENSPAAEEMVKRFAAARVGESVVKPG